MMNERYEEFVYREGYRRGKAERHKMLDDGTLVVSVGDATAVTRVLVEDDKKNGDLYYVMSDDTFEWCHDCKEYDQEKHCCHRWTKVIRNTVAELTADRPKGEWKWQRKIDGSLYHRCSECGYSDTERDFLTEYKFCPQCGADMRGADDE